MAKLSKGHKQVRCYADGGKVKPEYGKPTYPKAVAAKVSDKISDGYDWFPRAKAVMKSKNKRFYTNAARQKMLDET